MAVRTGTGCFHKSENRPTRVQSSSRIQSASNQSKLVPRKLDPGPSSKVGLNMSLALCWGLAYQGKDIVFKLMIEYSSLRDFYRP
jgi:hypothetical protein